MSQVAPKLSTYVVTHDFGFAPNPQFGVLTLACCKPQIRANSNVGDWILGAHSTRIGAGRVCFLGQVSQTLTFDQYYSNPEFQTKKAAGPPVGDNIYHRGANGQFVQSNNLAHGASEIAHDTSVDRVLICRRFWYFGKAAPALPEEASGIVKRGPGHRNIYNPSMINAVVAWAENYPEGKLAAPLGKGSPK